MAFNPLTAYDIERTNIRVRDFHDYSDDYETRPPYQRKVVWEKGKQQALLDSLFRRYYIPSIVIRLVRLSNLDTRYEVVDGQQRITTVQSFFANDLMLPNSLADVDPRLPGVNYQQLPSEIKKFVHKELKFDVDIIKNISDPFDAVHQEAATEIFWRLQQGESLNKMETAHARLSSLVRNFLVKYADDYDFNFATYETIDANPNKLRFFTETRSRTNSRMQHLSLLGRFLLIEIADGSTNVGDRRLMDLIEEYVREDGIGNVSYEAEPEAKALLRNLKSLTDVFADDPLLDRETYGTGVLAFRYEYFTISCYMLLRHLRRFYVYNDDVRILFREFVYDFFARTQGKARAQARVLQFVENRQQNASATETREQIIRLEFFEFAKSRGLELLSKDEKRVFSEGERIAIYLSGDGLCQVCLANGLPAKEARIPWSQFEADHVLPHSKGGQTLIENGQVLCREHNRIKGAAT